MSLCLIASASRLAGICILMILSACSAIPSADAPQVYLDQSTAATITVVGQPLVFARERPNFAVHMRDYITLAAASVNRAGKIEYVLIAYFWTTFDPHGRDGDAGSRHPDDLVVVADDRRIHPVRLDLSAHEAGIEERVHAPPVGAGVPTIYRTDPATLRFIAAARDLSAQTSTGDTELQYELWEDRRAALTAWVRHLDGD
jgi:hypothetical protein